MEERDTYHAKFNNRDLCFFSSIISCPSITDLRRLVSRANQTGELPHAKSIIATLQDRLDYDPNCIDAPFKFRLSHNQEEEDPSIVPTLISQVSMIHPDSYGLTKISFESESNWRAATR